MVGQLWCDDDPPGVDGSVLAGSTECTGSEPAVSGTTIGAEALDADGTVVAFLAAGCAGPCTAEALAGSITTATVAGGVESMAALVVSSAVDVVSAALVDGSLTMAELPATAVEPPDDDRGTTTVTGEGVGVARLAPRRSSWPRPGFGRTAVRVSRPKFAAPAAPAAMMTDVMAPAATKVLFRSMTVTLRSRGPTVRHRSVSVWKRLERPHGCS